MIAEQVGQAPAIAAQLGIGNWTWDVTARTASWSPALRAMYGVGPEARIGLQSLLDVVHPDDRSRVMAKVSETLAARGQLYEQRFRIVRSDGQVRRILSRAVVTVGTDGILERIDGVDIDLGPDDGHAPGSQELQTRVGELARLVQTFEATFGAAPLVAFVQDRELRYRWIFNPALDYRVDEVLGRTDPELNPNDADVAVLVAEKQAVISTRTPRRREVKVERCGDERWYDLYIHPHVVDGEIEGVQCIAFDLTDRKRAEAALAESESRYKALFSAIDEGYCLAEIITDGEGQAVDYRFLDVNPHFESMTGLKDAVGRTALELVPDLEPVWLKTYARAGLGRESFRFAESSATMGRSYEVFTGPVEPFGRFVIVFRDVTEREQRAERERLLLGEMTHRTKNILAVVQSVAQHTAMAGRDDFVQKFLERIASLAASHDLLVGGHWRSVDLRSLLESQLGHFAGLIGNRIRLEGAALQIQPQAAEALGIAVHELATNAGKYGALSSAAGGVGVAWAVEGGEFRFSWAERDGPPVAPPDRRGFGSAVLQRLARMSLEAAVDLDFAPTGLRWSLRCLRQRVVAAG